MHRVLIFERDPAFGCELANLLLDRGWDAIAAQNRREVLAAMRTRLVESVLFEVRSSDDLADLADMAIRHPVCAMLSSADPELALATRASGATEVLMKPFPPATAEVALNSLRNHAQLLPHGDRGPTATRCPAVQRQIEIAQSAAHSPTTILINGEPGTGKSTWARWLHHISARPGPFIELDATAVELKSGRLSSQSFAAAESGTLFLRRVNELDSEIQRSLLRRLAQRDLSPEPDSLACRLIASRNLDTGQRQRLDAELEARLGVFQLTLPPLRERQDDLCDLARERLLHWGAAQQLEPAVISPRSTRQLEQHHWRGNFHELDGLMRRGAIQFPGRELDLEALRTGRVEREAKGRSMETLNLEALERVTIERSLVETGGNRTRASSLLGISVRTLRNKLKRYELS